MVSARIRWIPPLAAAVLAGCASSAEVRDAQPAPERKVADSLAAENSPLRDAKQPAEEREVPADMLTERPSVQSEQATPETDRGEKNGKKKARRSVKINLTKQRFTYTEGGQVVRSGPISSGAKGHATPTGRFAVLDKDEDKVSSRYTNQLGMQAWMPYAVRFHGHYFMHEGWLPGYPDSHGCVRLGASDARFLFETLKAGDRVEVVR